MKRDHSQPNQPITPDFRILPRVAATPAPKQKRLRPPQVFEGRLPDDGTQPKNLPDDLLAYATHFLDLIKGGDVDVDAVRFIIVRSPRRWLDVTLQATSFTPPAVQIFATEEGPRGSLTARELDVLTLIAAGYGNKGIATALNTALRTVTTHIERIMRKLSQSSRAALAAIAVDRGLLRLPLPGGGRTAAPLVIGKLDRMARGMPELAIPQVGKPAGLAKRPFRIGAPLSLSGFAADDAREMLNGTRLAVSEMNARGGIAGRPIELVVADCDVSDASSMLHAVRNLIDAEVDAVSNGYSSNEAQVQDILADYGAPYLHCATMSAMVERVRNEPDRLGNVFQIGPSETDYGTEFLAFLSRLEGQRQWTPRNRKIAVVLTAWSSMNILCEQMFELAEHLDWTLEIIDSPLAGDGDWAPIVDRVNACDPSAVLFTNCFSDAAIAFQRAFAANPTDALVYMLYAPSVPRFHAELGPLAEGVLWATTAGTYEDRIGQDFFARYEQMHGYKPGRAHAGLAFDRVNLLANAWMQTEGPGRFLQANEALKRVVHRGVSGVFNFGNAGQSSRSFPRECPDPSLSIAHLIMQIQNGKDRILGPYPYANGTFKTPFWTRRVN